jgi:cobalt-zinc-cadmium efflux system outer membrane protein
MIGMWVRRAEGCVLIGLVVGAAACARVDPRPEWQTLVGLARERTGVTPVWERSDTEARAIEARVNDLLAGGLTRDAAVHIALLNNRLLQAAFQEIGVAKADLVQAGLYTNPNLQVALIFPLNLDDSAVALLGLLSDLWTVPAREAVAQTRAEEVIRWVATRVVDTATTAADAYDEVVYRRASLDLERSILEVRIQLLARTQSRAGSASAMDLARAESEMLDQQIAVARAERELVVARARLEVALSLSDTQRAYHVVDALDYPPKDMWTMETAVPFAMQRRLDLAAARLAVERRRREVAYERTQVFKEVAVGPGYEGAFGSDDGGGPVLGLDLPIFDQNQAQIAKAEYRLQQSQLELAAKEERARAEIQDALAEIEFRHQQVDIMRNRLQPARARAIEHGERHTGGAHVTFLDMLQARAQEIATRRDHLVALWELRRAQVRLQRALWGGAAAM